MLRDYGGKNTRSMRNISVALSLVWDHILQNTLEFFNVPGIKKYVSCCLVVYQENNHTHHHHQPLSLSLSL